jgi:hypothetical protein
MGPVYTQHLEDLNLKTEAESASETFLKKKTFEDEYSPKREIKNRLNSGNACYHSVQSLL